MSFEVFNTFVLMYFIEGRIRFSRPQVNWRPHHRNAQRHLYTEIWAVSWKEPLMGSWDGEGVSLGF